MALLINVRKSSAGTSAPISALDISKQAELEGVRSLRQSGLLKVKLGLTSLEEVLAVTNE